MPSGTEESCLQDVEDCHVEAIRLDEQKSSSSFLNIRGLVERFLFK